MNTAPFSNIRLKPQDLEQIIYAFKEVFAGDAHLWIFGSRVNPIAKGGDIDLYIETMLSDPKMLLRKKFTFVNKLYFALGEQKIDVVINMVAISQPLPIYEVAKTEGVKLV